MRVDSAAIPTLRDELARLGELFAEAKLGLLTAAPSSVVETRDSLERMIRDYLVPRLADPEAPIVAVVAGPSGSGKSTLLNSLAQDRIGHAGVRRPTTVNPVLWAHRDHSSRYWNEFVARVRRRIGSAAEVVIGDDRLTANLTLIDTPPVDWISPSGGRPALDLLALADLCVFVTSPARYADAAPWEFLQEVRWRGIPLIFVMNRLPADPDQQTALLEHLAAHLHARGLLNEPDASILFTVTEGTVEPRHGGLDPAVVSDLREKLEKISDPAVCRGVVESNAYSSVHNLVDRAGRLVEALDENATTATLLESMVMVQYTVGWAGMKNMVEHGELAELAAHKTWSKAVADLTSILTHRTGLAARAAAEAWAGSEVGSRLLADEGQSLWRHTRDTADKTRDSLERWAEEVGDLVSAHSRPSRIRQGTRRRIVQRIWSMVLDPSLAPSRALRRRCPGSEAELVAAARSSLVERLEAAFEADAARFRVLVDGAGTATATEAIAAQVERIANLIDPNRADTEPDAVSQGEPSEGTPTGGAGVNSTGNGDA